MAIKLGSKVRDPITGLEGIAVCRMEWLTGCNRMGIQAPVGNDGKVPDIHYVDEPQLEKVKARKKTKKTKGGPRPNPLKASDYRENRNV